MANVQFDTYLNEWPKGRRWWPKALAIFALLDGIYGAAAGSAIGALNSLADTHVRNRGNVVDATFVRDEEQDRME